MKLPAVEKEISIPGVKGMLRRNFEHFLEKRIWEKLGISEMK